MTMTTRKSAPWSGIRIYAPRTPDEACAGCATPERVAVDIEASLGSETLPLVGFGLCADCVQRLIRDLRTTLHDGRPPPTPMPGLGTPRS